MWNQTERSQLQKYITCVMPVCRWEIVLLLLSIECSAAASLSSIPVPSHGPGDHVRAQKTHGRLGRLAVTFWRRDGSVAWVPPIPGCITGVTLAVGSHYRLQCTECSLKTDYTASLSKDALQCAPCGLHDAAWKATHTGYSESIIEPKPIARDSSDW